MFGAIIGIFGMVDSVRLDGTDERLVLRLDIKSDSYSVRNLTRLYANTDFSA